MTLTFKTKGFNDIIDITTEVQQAVEKSGIKEGIVSIFVNGSTAAISTIEYESGVIEDLKRAIEKIAPQDIEYAHNAKWGDGNGFSHVRAALLKPGLTIPIEKGSMVLGTWQQIVLLDFDNKARSRNVIVKVIAS